MPNNSFERDAHYAGASFTPLKLGVIFSMIESNSQSSPTKEK